MYLITTRYKDEANISKHLAQITATKTTIVSPKASIATYINCTMVSIKHRLVEYRKDNNTGPKNKKLKKIFVFPAVLS